ncbi:MAG: hypothetical protein ACK5CW_00465 [Verrucomicrobiota bacterium]
MPSRLSSPVSRRQFVAAASTAMAALPLGCRRQPTAAKARPTSWILTPLATAPDWSRLTPWHGTLTREEFTSLIDSVLTHKPGAWFTHLQIRPGEALIRTASREAGTGYTHVFPFASRSTPSPAAARFWRRAEDLPPVSPTRPLDGVRIAIDPGHLGGPWATMEQRSFQHRDSPPIREGDLTLTTAQLLKPRLENLGASVFLVRDSSSPLTPLRPAELVTAARQSLATEGRTSTETEVIREAERLFYRTAEIRARGHRVNAELKPDLVVCLHFNADSWGNPSSPTLATTNHLHLIAHGCLLPGELTLDDQRLESLLRIVQRIPDTEIPLGSAVARSMAAATGLPPFHYSGDSAREAPGEPYLWLRNLLATRVYECPVIFLEPYVMNHPEVIDRIAAGDYEGMRNTAGRSMPSIFREYADGVITGIADYFRSRRPMLA